MTTDRWLVEYDQQVVQSGNRSLIGKYTPVHPLLKQGKEGGSEKGGWDTYWGVLYPSGHRAWLRDCLCLN